MNTSILHTDLSPHCQSWEANAKELKQKAPERFHSVISVDFPRIISRPVLNKFGWWVLLSDTSKFNIIKLQLFYILLLHYRFISCTYEEFEMHFIGDTTPKEKIIWEGDILILVLLFNKLIYEKGSIALTAESFYDLLFAHFLFLDKKNNRAKKLKHGSLKSSLNKSKSNSVVCGITENLITLLIN